MTPRSILGIVLMVVLAQGCAAVQRWEISRPTGWAKDGRSVDPPRILFTKGRAWSFFCCL
jgi:hypothetical protein